MVTLKSVPICRLIDETVRSGLVMAWRFASWPTSRSPLFVNATTDGVRRLPSELVMTVGVVPSIQATTELVVPRSMPTTFAMMIGSSEILVNPIFLNVVGRASLALSVHVVPRRASVLLVLLQRSGVGDARISLAEG